MMIKRIRLKEYKVYFPRAYIQIFQDVKLYKQKENLAEGTYNIHIFIEDYKPYFNEFCKNYREGRNPHTYNFQFI